MRRNNSKSAKKNCCAVVQIPNNPRKHPLASICFQPEFFDKKSPDSLWNLGLSDLHLLGSEIVSFLTLIDAKLIFPTISFPKFLSISLSV